jgi:hypothetical protein
MKPGIYRDISNEAYHAAEGVSKSDMQELLRSPAHFHAPEPPEDAATEAMKFGAAMHPGILEPERFAKEYVVYPESCLVGSGEGQQGRKAAFDEEVQAKGQIVIKPQWMDQIIAMRDAVLCNPDVRELHLLEGGEAELSAWWSDPDFEGVLTKIRPDYLCKDTRRIVDLKSTTDARDAPFTKIAYDKGYHLQAAHYSYTTTRLTGIPHEEFFFIAVERPKIKGQYVGVVVYRADEEMIAEGLKGRSRALTLYNECMRTGQWPGYPLGVRPLGLPGWKKRKEPMMIID